MSINVFRLTGAQVWVSWRKQPPGRVRTEMYAEAHKKVSECLCTDSDSMKNDDGRRIETLADLFICLEPVTLRVADERVDGRAGSGRREVTRRVSNAANNQDTKF